MRALFPSCFATPPHVLITGAQGFLGARLGAFLMLAGVAARIAAPAASGAHTPCACAALALCTRESFSLTSADSVRRTISEFAPDLVFHCAAVSDTGQAEREPELSRAVNVEGTLLLAEACREAGAKLVAMSSDQVYNGTHLPGDPPLPETAPLAPQNVYGCHKLEAEQRALALLPSAVFLRLSWMYDTLDTPFRQNRNLLCSLTAAAQSGEAARFAVHEWRGVTDVWQVVRALAAAAGFPGGVYNFGSENALPSYKIACAAAALLGLPAHSVQPDEARFAPEGRNLAMDCTKARIAGAAFPDTLTGIAQALR